MGSELLALDVVPYFLLRSAQATASGFVLEHGPARRNKMTTRPGPLVADRMDFVCFEMLHDFRGEPFISARGAVCLNTPDVFLKDDDDLVEEDGLPIG